jgi:hypothetical protein
MPVNSKEHCSEEDSRDDHVATSTDHTEYEPVFVRADRCEFSILGNTRQGRYNGEACTPSSTSAGDFG